MIRRIPLGTYTSLTTFSRFLQVNQSETLLGIHNETTKMSMLDIIDFSLNPSQIYVYSSTIYISSFNRVFDWTHGNIILCI